MAAANRILTLNLGSQSVGLAEFKSGGKGGLVLNSYQTRELMADPAADATRQAQTKLLVQEMVAAMKLKGQPVNYAVSAQQVFTRFVKLPSVGEEQVDQIVTFEAQQNVPYPINEVVWGYQLVGSGAGGEVEVVIVAVKSDLLDEINDAVETSGLQTSVVDVAPMAIYNAFRYNYADVGGCSLVLDIGSRTTNLIFIEPNKVFSRSIPNGGTTITTQIAKEFNETFAEAEQRKRNEGFVSLGGAYAEPDDADVARLSKLIRNSLTRLHAEIARSITFYRSQQGGSAPERVFLSGGSASLPYIREFFHEKLNLPVEIFNPMRNVTVSGGVSAEQIGHQAHTLGEVVGLALRSSGSCPMELNLQPASVVKREMLSKRRPFLVLAALSLLALLAGFWLYNDRAAKVTAAVTESLTPEVNALKGLETKMKAARKDIDALVEQSAPLLQATEDRQFWLKVINDINSRLPKEYVWITSFESTVLTPKVAPTVGRPKKGAPAEKPPEPRTIVQLKGFYLFNDKQAGVVDEFVEKLEQSEIYEVLKKEEDGFIRAVPNEADWAYEFAIPLALKKSIALPETKK
jgi:type IV pilus assembly protein PilM